MSKVRKKNYNLIVDINDNLLDIEQNLIFVQYDFYEELIKKLPIGTVLKLFM